MGVGGRYESRKESGTGARAERGELQPSQHACGLALLAAQAATPAFAGPTEQAERIYERLAGVQPSPAVLAQMVTAITNKPGQAGLVDAAAIATDPKTAPTFYNVALKNMVMPWTNRDQTVFVPFNDYAATVIGMVRDNVAVQHGVVR